MKIGAVVSYCTNDKDFLEPCLDNLLPICDEIIVSYSDKFFDGTPENIKLIKKQSAKYSSIKFCEFKYDETLPSRKNHNKQRQAGYAKMNNSIEKDWIMFIDVDEVIDSDKFKLWMKEYEKVGSFSPVLRFATYIYFLSPALRSTFIDQSFIMIQKNKLDLLSEKEMINLQWERHSLMLLHQKDKKEYICGLDGYPISHHYSLVRTKEEMLKKVKSWGHNNDFKNDIYWKVQMGFTENNWEERVEKKYFGISIWSQEGKNILNTPDNVTPTDIDGSVAFTFPPIIPNNNPEILAIDFWHQYKYYWTEPYIKIEGITTDQDGLYDLLNIDITLRIGTRIKLLQKLSNVDEYRIEYQILTDEEILQAEKLSILHRKNDKKWSVNHGKN
jgi:hypothetical protein